MSKEFDCGKLLDIIKELKETAEQLVNIIAGADPGTDNSQVLEALKVLGEIISDLTETLAVCLKGCNCDDNDDDDDEDDD